MKFPHLRQDSDFEQLEAKVAEDPKFGRLFAAFYDELSRLMDAHNRQLAALRRQARLLKRALAVLASVVAVLVWLQCI